MAKLSEADLKKAREAFQNLIMMLPRATRKVALPTIELVKVALGDDTDYTAHGNNT